MKKKYLILIALIVAALLTSAFVFLSPGAGEDEPSGGGEAAGDAEAPGDEDTGDAGVADANGPDASDPGAEDPGAEDPDGDADDGEELVPGPDEAEEAAGILQDLGILKGVGAGADGGAELDLHSTLTREQAAAMIARTRGYSADGEDMAFPCPFGDVSQWAAGAVGYLKCSGVVSGYSDASFGGDGLVQGRELLSMALRSAGYGGDYAYGDIMSFAQSLGLTDGRLGDGTDPISRGDTAIILKNALALPFKGSDRTPLTVLIESGLVTVEQLDAAGLTEAAPGLREDAIPASEAAGRCAPLMVTVETRDLMLKPIATVTGTIAGDDVIALPLYDLRGAAYITVTGAAGNDIPYTSISYDLNGGLAYLNCTVKFPELAAAEPGASTADLAYVYSDKAAPILGPKSVRGRPGLPVLDASGRFAGITTASGVAAVRVPDVTPVNLFDLGRTFWPDDAPKFKPHGIDPTKPMVAVTYDDGPSKANTPKLLDILEENKAVATFFECGYMLVNYTGSLLRMESIGCEIGNHSYSHANLNTLSADGIRDEIARTNDLIRGVVGHDATVVRAPYGNANATVKSAVDAPLIQWNVDTLDWQSRNANSVVNKVFANSNLDGYIILMHSLYSSTVTASRTIIPGLIERGYQLVTVSELAYFRGVEMENGSLYYSFKP